MEIDEERKSRLEKIVATAQLMLALTKSVVNVGMVLSLNPFRKVGNYAYVPNNLYLIILIVSF